MSALPGHSMLDDGNIDSNYLQFVVGLLDDTDNYSDYVGRERADSISEFLKRERADSITDFLKRERQDSITDFLPKQSDFLMRDRAFSWDLNMEEQGQMQPDKTRGIAAAAAASSNAVKMDSTSSSTSSTSSSSAASVADKKRKAEVPKAPPVNAKIPKTLVKSPPLPVKPVSNKPVVPQYKMKPPQKTQQIVDPNIKRPKIPYPIPDNNKYVPQKMMDQYNLDISKLVPGAMLGQQVLPLTHTGQPHTLTRYDPFSAHLMDHGGMIPTMHPMDASCPRVGAYTKEERQVIIAKFRAKKMRRVWRKQIKYDCRKRLADTRPRVKGRFVSRKEREGEQDDEKEETASGEGDY